MPVHVEDTENPETAVYSDIKLEKLDNVELVSEAKIAAEEELNMGLWDAVKLYPNAVGWSILLSTAVIMEGYDVVLLGSL
jgi:SP family general alpha glucoside:H+ symporter-like MFS transporter